MIKGVSESVFSNAWPVNPATMPVTSVSGGGAPLGQALTNLRQQVDYFDGLASGQVFIAGEKDFTDKFATCAAVWGSRVGLGVLGDKYYTLPKDNPFLQRAQGLASPLTKDFKPYHQLLGLKQKCLRIGQDQYFQTFRNFFQSHDGWRAEVKENFENFLKPEFRQGLTVKGYLANTLLGGNINGVTTFLKQGKIVSAGLMTLGLGMLLWQILSKTHDAYSSAQAKEDGSLWSKMKTFGSTVLNFVGQAVKGIASWEIGTMGLSIGKALIAVEGWPLVIAGITVGALASALSYKLLSRIIPDPPEPVKLKDALEKV